MQEENRNLEIILAGVQKTDTKILPFDNQTIEDITEKIPVLKDGYDITIDGRIISKGDWPTYFLYPEDKIVCVPNFGAGAITLAIMGLAAAPAVAFTLTYLTYIALYAAISIGISLGVGYLIKSLTPSPKKAAEMPSQAYSWEPKTTQQQGLVKPKVFGKFKSLGNIIAGHVSIKAGDKYKLVMNALVSHGTGPVKSISDIRLNNQPESNFPDVVTDSRRGLLEQTPIAAFVPLKIQFRPNIDITNAGGPLIWEVPSDDYNDIELILRYVAYYFHKDGDRETQTVGTKIEIRELPAGGWNTVFDGGVYNSNTKTFWQSFKMSTLGYDVIQGKKHEIRVTHTNGDYEPGYRKQRQMALEFVTEISDDALEYPGLVLVGISGALTDAFTGLQSTSCIIEGQIVYQWDDVAEEWILDWTDNPGYVAGCTLTQPVISGDGVGTPYAIEKLEGMPNDRINWDDVKELVEYCDTECPDGKGGVEPLITFNGSFDTAISTWDATLDVCKIARSVPIWKGNVVDFVIDKPTARTDVIAAGNIIDGSFDETFLPKKDRVSAIDVAYNDINSNYDRIFLRTFSSVLPESSNVLTLDCRGIVKKTEAWRLAKFHQAYNDHIHRTIKCKADIDALTYKLGEVLGVQWDATNWNKLKEIGQRGSGRIKAFTYDAGGDIITLDYDIENAFEDGNTYEILIRLNDSTQVLKTIASAVGNVITIVGHYAVEPRLNDLWIVGLQNYVVKDFRLINRSRSKNISYELALLEYNEDIWANDALSPPITGLYTTPAKSDTGSVIQPPSQKDLESLVPEEAIGGGGGNWDLLGTTNIKFITSPPGGLEDYYNVNDNDAVVFQGDFWEAQTFEASSSYDIESVKLKLYKTSSPGTITVGIRNIDGSGHPVAPDLCSGTTDGDTLPLGPDDILYQSNSTGGDGQRVYCSACQTFTPEVSHTLYKIGLLLKKGATPAAFTGTINLYAVDGAHKPTGASLLEIGSFTREDLTTSYVWYNFADLDYSLVADTEYAIVIVVSGDDVCNHGDGDTLSYFYWDAKIGGYGRGEGWHKLCALNGVWACRLDWSVPPGGVDFCFKEYREAEGVEWREITFTVPYSLVEGTTYAIVARTAGYTGEVWWRAELGSPPGYADGCREQGTYGTWQTHTQYDYMFETYSSDPPEGAIDWIAEDGETEMLLSYLGEVYIIEPGQTTLKYIYWNPIVSETTLQATDTQSVIVAGDFSVLCFNKGGIPYVQ